MKWNCAYSQKPNCKGVGFYWGGGIWKFFSGFKMDMGSKQMDNEMGNGYEV